MNDGAIALELIRTSHILEARLEEALAKVKLSGPKFAALSVLAGAGEPLGLCDLAGRLSCVRSNVTQLVDRLEADGLVRRGDDPKDRRGVRAELTARGRERQQAGAEQVAEVEKQFARRLAGFNAQELGGALRAIREP